MLEKLLAAALAAAALAAPGLAAAAEEGVRLDPAPIDVANRASVQAGARTYMNYCLGCHGLALVRYNQLLQIGLTEDQIRDNLLFTGEKIGDMMVSAMARADGARWFGAAPPDLSVIGRSRGADWLYTYLRGFYRDPATPTGWNNVAFPNVGMPHVLWTLQGERGLEAPEHGKAAHGAAPRFVQLTPGTQTAQEYDATVRDLVAFLAWASDPTQLKRKQLGVVVLLALTLLAFVSWLLYKEYWKDVR
ncbi:MAG: cytochrome c1 [Burkholderiales bacterium]|nr:cytochrome c1 [Burkholderiales bacterium]